MAHAHLERAREYLAIAESDNPKREAYIKAAEEIVAALAEDKRLTRTAVATAVGIHHQKVVMLVKWHESGYKAKTPWLLDDKATTRAAISHAKKVLREHPEEVKEEIAHAATENSEVINAITMRQVEQAQHARIRSDREEDRSLGTPGNTDWFRFMGAMADGARALRRIRDLAESIDYTKVQGVFGNDPIAEVEARMEEYAELINEIRDLARAPGTTDDDVRKGLSL
jgi:hypothetical protein